MVYNEYLKESATTSPTPHLTYIDIPTNLSSNILQSYSHSQPEVRM